MPTPSIRCGRFVAAPLLLLSAACAAPMRSAPPPPAPRGGEVRAQVLLLGTFHFRDAGLDDHKPQVRPDISSPRRQHELARLLQMLEGFRPTLVAVEWPAAQQAALDSAYTAYLAGGFTLTENEIHQVAFQLAKRLGHTRLAAVDAPARHYGQAVETQALVERATALGQQELIGRATRWFTEYGTHAARVDSLVSRASLPEALLFLNSPEYLRTSAGHYLVGQMEVGGRGDYLGADTRTAWYNRNLRIFSNIQRAVPAPGQRVLVLVGAGHVPILSHLVGSSPELELVPVARYVRAR